MPNVNLSPYSTQQNELDRRRKLAQALMQESVTPLEMPQQPGVQISPYAGLAKILSGIVGNYKGAKLDKEQRALDTSKQEAVRSQLAQLLSSQGGTTQYAGPVQFPTQRDVSLPPGPEVMANSLGSEFPQVQQLAAALMGQRSKQEEEQRGATQQDNHAKLVAALQAQDPYRIAQTQNLLQPPAPRNIDPLSPEGIAAQQQLKPPPTTAPRNIDPLSPEGVAARLDFENRQPKQPAREPLVAIIKDGKSVLVPQSQAVGQTPASTRERAATGQERTALGFFNRGKSALEIIEGLEPDVQKMGLGAQSRMEYAPNFMQSELGQSYRQAQRQFTEARLRKESGAAINDAEYEKDARTYFAVPGDSPKTLEQKRKARGEVLESLKISSGRAYQEYYGDEGPPQTETKVVNGVTYRKVKGGWQAQ